MTSPGAGPPSEVPPSPPAPPTSSSAPAALHGSAPVPAGGISGDWPAQATDAIVNAVDTVRDRTTGPLQTAARGVVYGVIAAVLGVMVAILLIVAAIRLLDAALPVGGIWLPYLILGAIFLVGGWLVFRRRRLTEL